jgi:hypothetical protein
MKNYWLDERKDKMMTAAKVKERKEAMRRTIGHSPLYMAEQDGKLVWVLASDDTKEDSE